MPDIIFIAVAACVFALLASFLINWAGSKSPRWNMGFGLIVVLAGTGLLLLTLVVVIRLLLGTSP